MYLYFNNHKLYHILRIIRGLSYSRTRRGPCHYEPETKGTMCTNEIRILCFVLRTGFAIGQNEGGGDSGGGRRSREYDTSLVSQEALSHRALE